MLRRTLLLAALAASAAGQGMVSTRAGLVQRAEGHVQLSDIAPEDLPVDRPHHMEPGQHMRTLYGRAEVVLTPGNYWRISGRSEVVLVDDRFESMEMRLVDGAMLVDLRSGSPGKDYGAALLVDEIVVEPLERGEYLLVRREGAPLQLQVHRGKAEVRSGSKRVRVGGGRGLELTPALDEPVEKIEHMRAERLSDWSRLRRAALWEQDGATPPAVQDLDPLHPAEIDWIQSEDSASSGPR